LEKLADGRDPVIPDYLQIELNKTDWRQLQTAIGTGEELPANINGLLTGDDRIAEKCAERIRWSVCAHGGYYDAAYATATVLARILPVAKEPQRLLALLYKIMSQPALRTDGYAELVSSLVFLAPQLRQWAVAPDHVMARQAQHILMHAGQGMPGTEMLFRQEWQDATHPPERRAYALFCLGRLYEIEEAYGKMRNHFIEAYQQEPLALLRAIMAIFLVRDAEARSDVSWTDTIIQALAEPDTLKGLDLVEIFTGYDVAGFLEMLLDDANVKR